MSQDKIFSELNSAVSHAIEALGRDFAGLRTGRAHPSLVDNLKIEAYGQQMPLKSMATVTVQDARTIGISPFDPSQGAAIEKGILTSDLGITPTNDGKLIRITLPELTQDRRKELSKLAKQMTENAKVSIRHARQKANDTLKAMEKNKEISQDDSKKAAGRVQGIVDDATKKVDLALKNKETEILG
ncbi:MAG: ribosome recycling factor [Deltaproteobacteria bacterium]|nr:ribosome recycling factor [Deltaproteobacteria bacterium]